MLDVYRTYYKLTGEPFRLSPDHRFSLGHRSYANAKAYLDYALLQGEGFIAITGAPGTGKTTLISDILAGFEETDMQVATLTSTQLESRDLLHMVAHSFDLHPEDRSKSTLLLELERFLNQQSYRGHRTILIVDEAQSLSSSALEELRLLANMQRKDQLLLQIFLVGQEKLLDLIHAPGMEQLQQRLVAASVLEPLNLDETVDYVDHRLCLGAWRGDPAISEEALHLVYKYSGGIPRRINMICNRLFLYGGMQQKHELVGEDARTVIEDLYKERLLAPGLPGKQSGADTFVAKSRDTGLPALSLPRAESFVRTEKPRQQSMQTNSEAPAADNTIPLTRPVSPAPLNERNREISTADRPARESLPVESVESGTAPEEHRRWKLAAVFGVLAGLVGLVVTVNRDIGRPQADLMLAAPAGIENRIATAETVPEEKAVLLPDPVLARVTNNPDRPLLAEIGMMDTKPRDSALPGPGTEGEKSHIEPLARITEPVPVRPEVTSVPELSQASLAGVLNKLPCAAFKTSIEDGEVGLQGYVSRQLDVKQLEKDLLALPGARVVSLNLEKVDKKKCAVIELFAPYWASNRSIDHDALIQTGREGNLFTEGEMLVVKIATPDYESYVNIDYHSLDGSVVHMVPGPRARDNQAPANYKATIGDLGEWTISEPFGTEMVTVVLTPQPLFETLRVEIETDFEYLAAVREQLDRITKKSGKNRIAVDFVMIDTKSKSLLQGLGDKETAHP
jgi:type II secretory pathway predicted ATPase ExeA